MNNAATPGMYGAGQRVKCQRAWPRERYRQPTVIWVTAVPVTKCYPFWRAGVDGRIPELNVKDRLSRRGVGPRIAAELTYAAAVGAVTHRWPN